MLLKAILTGIDNVPPVSVVFVLSDANAIGVGVAVNVPGVAKISTPLSFLTRVDGTPQFCPALLSNIKLNNSSEYPRSSASKGQGAMSS